MTAPVQLKYAVKAVSNIHHQGDAKNIFLLATPRSGSTWAMELLASQPGMKYYDEPFNIRRDNVARTGLFPTWESLMPNTGDPDRIIGFLQDLAAGRYPHMNPPPFRRHHRLFTNRIVFKILELEHLIGTMITRCNALAVYLLRHPIPTTLSRQVFPRLELFVKSPYYQELLGEARCREVDALVAGGSHLQRGLVSWCYENLLPLTRPDFEGLFITYEELVVNPQQACELLVSRLGLPDPEAMLRTHSQPAMNIEMSSEETRARMRDPDEQRRRAYLATRWMEKVTPRDQADCTAILDLFGLHTYRGDAPLAAQAHLHFPETTTLLGAGRGNEPAAPRD